MKKKILGILLCLVAVLGISTATALAEITTGDGYTYDTETKTLTVTTTDGLTGWANASPSIAAAEVENLIIGNGINEITSEYFAGCKSSLKSVVCQGDILISGGAFNGFSSIKEVTFEGNATVSNVAFKASTALEKITFKGTSTLQGYAFGSCPNIKSITFGGATNIKGEALRPGSDDTTYNTKLRSLVFPAGSTIDMKYFSNYTKLASITFKGDITLDNLDFQKCTSLKSVVFKGKCTLKDHAFSECTALASITFEDECTLSDWALTDCISLVNITFKKTATIEGKAFSCTETGTNENIALTSLVIPAGSTISKNAFENCTSLDSVTFEGNVKLDECVFPGCTSLRTFYFNSESTTGIDFANCTFKNFAYAGIDAITIYVPTEDSVTAYKAKLREDASSNASDGHNALYEVCVKCLPHSWNENTGICEDCDAYDPSKIHTAEPTWQYDSTQHWQICDECKGRMNVANHVYDSSSDTDCNVCGYARTIYSGGGSGSGSGSSGGSSSSGTSGSGSGSSSGSGSTGTSTGGSTGAGTGTGTDAGTGTGTDSGTGTGTDAGTGTSTGTDAGTGADTETPAQTPTISTSENGTVTPSTDGTTATITPDAGYEVETVKVNGEDKGTVYKLTGLKTGDKVDVTFTKSTFSGSVSKLTPLVVRTSKTAKKNIKVTLKLSDSNKVAISALESLGYTVKYKFYRSTKKYTAYKAMKTKATTTYINSKGVKKKMYYYKARIMVYDANGTLVAKTALKDCKYGSRRFG